MNIRPFTPDDYPAVADIFNAVYPDFPRTVEEIRFQDEHRDPKCKAGRFVAERDGRVVASATYNQFPWSYHPRKFWVNVSVLPDYQGQGIGSAMYEQVVTALEAFDPISLRSGAREDRTRSVQFLQRRGFQEVERVWVSRLDVTKFDFAPYNGAEEKVRAQGVEIKSLRELQSDPDCYRKLYAMQHEVVQDIPTTETLTEMDFDHWLDSAVNNPNFLPDGYFIAVHNGEYVGTSALWKMQGSDMLDTGLTGVKRAYRRKGIALAMKLCAIAYAKEHGCPTIQTDNHSTNRGMLSINEMLGFVKEPAHVNFVKALKEESDGN